jgi:hypothetical protein
MWPAILVHAEKEYPCTLVDVSELGARIESGEGSFTPSYVTLKCDRFGSIDGWLLWSKRNKAGISFDRTPAEVHRLLSPIVPGLDRKRMPPSSPRCPNRPGAFGRLPRRAAAAPELAARPASVPLNGDDACNFLPAIATDENRAQFLHSERKRRFGRLPRRAAADAGDAADGPIAPPGIEHHDATVPGGDEPVEPTAAIVDSEILSAELVPQPESA